MKRTNNELLKREFKKTQNNLIIGIIFIFFTILSGIMITYDSQKVPKDSTSLNTIIESVPSTEELKKEAIYLNDAIEDNNTENVNAYITISAISDAIATYKGTSKSIYVISDKEYYYLICLSDAEYKRISELDLEKNPETVYGVTKKTESNV